jgi:hypothetical protein
MTVLLAWSVFTAILVVATYLAFEWLAGWP